MTAADVQSRTAGGLRVNGGYQIGQRRWVYHMSRRTIDMHAESVLAEFLDAYFYDQLLDKGLFSSVERIHDADTQKAGVDVRARRGSAIINIDEKAQLYYINKDLPTFAFELEYLQQGVPRLGWLLKETLLTTHYFLLWPFATTTKVSQLKMTDLTAVNGLMLQKRRLLQYLESLGLDNRTLRAAAEQTRKDGTVGKRSISQDGIYLYASDPGRYSEAPVNLIVRRSLLTQLSDRQYRITPNGSQRLK